MTTLQTAELVRKYLSNVRAESELRQESVSFKECAKWSNKNGQLVHDTGKFFSIKGIVAGDIPGAIYDSEAVMIDQPEVGWLGFIVRPGPDGIEWLGNAKTEPGNIGGTQLAPSIQATRSNYLRAHGGRATKFLDLFQNAKTFVSDAPNSEQGTRFLWKFNRNSVLILPQGALSDLADSPQWSWCSSAAMRDILADDYAINTDARSVISTAPWALLSSGKPLFSAPVLAKSYHHPRPAVSEQLQKKIGPVGYQHIAQWQNVLLDDLKNHTLTDLSLCDDQGNEVVTCFDISVKGREVDNWCQPFLMQCKIADHVLYMRVTDDGAEFFVRVYRELGFARRREYGPSTHSEYETPVEMHNWETTAPNSQIISIHQSDEGGRFMHADAAYRVVLVENSTSRKSYPFGTWVTLFTLEKLVAKAGSTTNELRSVISLLLSQKFDTACKSL